MKELYFSHIPKSAGRSLVYIVEEESEKKLKEPIYIGEQYFYKYTIRKHKYYYSYYLKNKYLKKFIKFDNESYKYNKSKTHWNIQFWHIPLSFWKNNLLLDLKKNKLIFLVVRNPYSKIISVFKFWIKFYYKHKTGNFRVQYKNLLNLIENVYENNFDLTPKNMNYIIQKLLSSKKYEYTLDGHLIPQYKYIYTVINNKLIKIPDEILRFENLEEDFKKFKNKYLKFIPNNSLKKTHLNPTQDKNLNIDEYTLTFKTKKLIYNYYKLDFKLLNYSKD